MQRRSRFERAPIRGRISPEWIEANVRPRITPRDRSILRFLYLFRVATSDQIARLWFTGGRTRCNQRLRVLWDLRCIDRHFPPVVTGSSMQHVLLGTAGAGVIGVEYRCPRVPRNLQHAVRVSEYVVQATLAGLPWPRAGVNLGPVVPDIWYPDERIAVEIDTGTESHRTLERRAEGYRGLDIEGVVFLTQGPIARAQRFLAVAGQHPLKIGVTWERIDELLHFLAEKHCILPRCR